MSNFSTEDFHIDNGTITGFTDAGKQKLKASGGIIDSFPAEATAIGVCALSSQEILAIRQWGNITRLSNGSLANNRIVVIPESWGNITSIGRGAFLWNKITALPNSWGGVTVIGDDAFSNNNIVSIPHNWELVKTIGDRAFSINAIVSLPESCGNLEVVGDYAFEGNKIREKVSFESVESVGTLPLFDNRF